MEAIRALMVAKRSARAERTQTINQARALILTGPDYLLARFSQHDPSDLVAELAALRPRPGGVVGYATRVAVRELGLRAEFLDGQLERLDELIVPLVTTRAPGLLALYGASAPIPPRCSWSRQGITPNGSTPKPPGRTCAPTASISSPPPERSPGTGSTPAATGRPTTPCGGSSSPG